jgi:hypothetical protein
MATITKTTVEVNVGSYVYRADVEGGRVELYRDGDYAGTAAWTGTLESFPKTLSADAKDKLEAAIDHNLRKAYFARTETFGKEVGGDGDAVLPRAAKTSDAGNKGQMGDEPNRPARQGEAEVGVGGPGCDPNTGELGGQAIKPHRRAVGDGFRKS